MSLLLIITQRVAIYGSILVNTAIRVARRPRADHPETNAFWIMNNYYDRLYVIYTRFRSIIIGVLQYAQVIILCVHNICGLHSTTVVVFVYNNKIRYWYLVLYYWTYSSNIMVIDNILCIYYDVKRSVVMPKFS